MYIKQIRKGRTELLGMYFLSYLGKSATNECLKTVKETRKYRGAVKRNV